MLLPLAGLCLAGARGAEAVPPALSLAEAERLALENNPALRAAVGRAEAAAGRAAQLALRSNPELEFAAEEWPWRRAGGFSDAKQTVGIAQALPLPSKRALDRRIGGAGTQAGRAELAARRAELLRDVRTAYVRAVAAGRAVGLAEQLTTVAATTADVARRRVEAGAAALPEQLRAEVLHEQARAALTDRRSELTEVCRDLAALLGRADLGETPLADALVETTDAELLRLAEVADAAGHPKVQAAQAELDRADAALRRARLDALPDPTLGVSAGRDGAAGTTIVGLRLSVPVPVFDRGQARQREARAALTTATADLRAAEQSLRHERAAAALHYRNAGQQVTDYRARILPKADEALRLVRAGFEQGKFGFTDLLDTQRTTADVQLAYLQKLLELNLAHAELAALLAAEPASTATSTR